MKWLLRTFGIALVRKLAYLAAVCAFGFAAHLLRKYV